MSAKDLESALREGGEKVSQGQIRIDSARALQRLRDFRFAEPAHWVLEVLRSAALSGAKTVTVRTDADDVELAFDGKPFPTDSMKHLLEQALNGGQSDDEKRTRLLALGAAGALGVGARFVKVHSGGIALTLHDDQVELVEAPGRGTTLHLRKAFGWRVAAAFLRGSPEALAITQRAHRFPARLALNGQILPPPDEGEVVASKVLEGEGWRMQVVLPGGPPLASSALELDVAGVLVAQRTRSMPGLQLRAWLRADGLRRNASGSDVVDDDEVLEAALGALRKLSRQWLAERGATLAEDDGWRRSFIKQLRAEDTLDGQAGALLQKVPLIPGPSGELWTLAELAAAAKEHSRLYVAHQSWAKGSYPEPTVLLEGETAFVSLLPDAKRVDVEALVKQKEVIAINRQRLLSAPVEPAQLPTRNWVARAAIEATAVTGEVGFENSGNGAFVRVLHQGRQLEAGEITALAPLRLRAVVDWSRPLADMFFSENGSTKLLGLVLKYVEAAATRAICEALPRPEVLPHALDLLTRMVTLRSTPVGELPAQLLAAPLFASLEGPVVSLQTLLDEPRWRYVGFRAPEGLLDGSRVLVLPPAQRDVLKALGPKRLEDVTSQLRDEDEVRRRLAGPKQAAAVSDVVVKVPFVAEGMHGEVGVPRDAGARLSLTLLKSGLLLETTELSPRYHHAVAAVECSTLSPNARWTGVTRDAAFKGVAAAVHDEQRKLAVALVGVPRSEWTTGAELYLLAFLKKELHGFKSEALDEVTRAVASAPIFQGAHGGRSLLQLKKTVVRSGLLYVLPASGPRPPVPDELEVIFEGPALAAALGEALGQLPADPTPVLEKHEARRRLASRPLARLALPEAVAFECRFTEGRFTVLAGLAEGRGHSAQVQVLLDGRVYASPTLDCALPLSVVIDAPALEPTRDHQLTEGQLGELSSLLETAAQAVLLRALAAKDDPQALRVVLLALGRNLDQALPKDRAQDLTGRAVFPCTDGQLRSARDLDERSPQFVLTELKGVLPNRRPIVLARDLLVVMAMSRWPQAEQVDGALSLQLAALRQREEIAPVQEIRSSAKSPWRQTVSENGMIGEVVVAREGAGRIELFLDRKPLWVLEGALPAPLAAAIDSPRLTPKPGFAGVVEDAHFTEAVDALKAAGERLAAQLATRPRVPGWDEALVRLALHLGAAQAWEWKGQKKKGKGKKKPEPVTAPPMNPLLAAPLLRGNDGSPLSVQLLIARQRTDGRVEVTKQGGRFLEAGRTAWWPRPDEWEEVKPLGLSLDDVTPELQLAESIRSRPRFEQVVSPLAGPWREAVRGPGIDGEVAIGAAPDGTLSIEVLHEKMLIERWSSPHPVGGVARVDSSALNPDGRWTAVKRDASFKALVSATEAALERLLVRRLAQPDGGSRAWAGGAVKWKSGQAGPLAAIVPGLPLFADVKGAPVTVGAVMDLATRKGRVPLAGAMPADDVVQTLVVLDSPETRGLLTTLGLAFEDITGELRRAKDLERALTTRRLASLTWKAEALVKIAVAQGPLNGELALSMAEGKAGVMLARDGIFIAPLEDAWPGVGGVIDVKDLTVNADWTTAQPTRAQRTLIRAQVERLYLALAEAAPSFGDRERELAATWALRFLADAGVEAAAHLDRLTGAARELADAPLFITVEGERVNLRAVASEVTTREKVAVLERSVGVPEGAVACVLATSSWNAPWLPALEDLLGKSKVWRVTELQAWQEAVREADPPEGTPALQGLRFLRREVRLLRAGALGPLTPDELEDVRLSRAGGSSPLRYDRERKLVLLDPEHPDIARTLTEAPQRPERVWVLIAALFGLVNRELASVTDAQEAQLLMALAGHLAHNPKLLSPAGAKSDEK